MIESREEQEVNSQITFPSMKLQNLKSSPASGQAGNLSLSQGSRTSQLSKVQVHNA